MAHATSDSSADPIKVGRYPVSIYEDCVEIDISRDNGGWSGCGHANEIEIDLPTLERMIEAVKAEKDGR